MFKCRCQARVVEQDSTPSWTSTDARYFFVCDRALSAHFFMNPLLCFPLFVECSCSSSWLFCTSSHRRPILDLSKLGLLVLFFIHGHSPVPPLHPSLSPSALSFDVSPSVCLWLAPPSMDSDCSLQPASSLMKLYVELPFLSSFPFSLSIAFQVIEYVGEVIRGKVADVREKQYERNGIGSCYMVRTQLLLAYSPCPFL